MTEKQNAVKDNKIDKSELHTTAVVGERDGTNCDTAEDDAGDNVNVATAVAIVMRRRHAVRMRMEGGEIARWLSQRAGRRVIFWKRMSHPVYTDSTRSKEESGRSGDGKMRSLMIM
ncbi:hypothetical protein LOAG_03646 [Loa loa]|uniref:Uncharacterized protein n=1 Tax=Loa loa TaxID=7209 RepID=A0A1S0U489_LOALO|nr:hypothetical protein LOAG_03646 [Loa loa]EFO24843.1 hypothetical protein LOAG_03646 [Loa loa]